MLLLGIVAKIKGIIVLKIAICGGKLFVLWSEIMFYGDVPVEP